MKRAALGERRFWIPEVLQTSPMDCGPAALKAVLAGFGVSADYDLLRERCATDVGGTSIDALQALACELGLVARQVLIPRDGFLLPESDALPAIVVTRIGGGLLHFSVVWRRVGPRVQVMDPRSGRRWLAVRDLLSTMPDLPIPISKPRWRTWAGSERALAPLRRRLRALGIRAQAVEDLTEAALRDESWRGLATLDAAARMVTTLRDARALSGGRAAERLLRSLLNSDVGDAASSERGIPARFWWATQGAQPDKLLLHGAVILHFSREASATQSVAPRTVRWGDSRVSLRWPKAARARIECAAGQPRAPELDASSHILPSAWMRRLRESGDTASVRPLWQLVRWDARRILGWVCIALAGSAVLAAAEALLFQGVWQTGSQLVVSYQRLAALVALGVFALCGFLLELSMHGALRRIGARLELRLRMALLEALPRLEDAYVRTRTAWDLASRAHAAHLLREVPPVGARVVRAVCTLLATAAGIAWLHPSGGPWLVLGALLTLVVPWIAHRPLSDRVMRVRSQNAALDRLYLDAMLGATAVRAHGGERAVQREHEGLLTDWMGSACALNRDVSAIQAAHLLTTVATTLALVLTYLHDGGAFGGVLLLLYWSTRMGLVAQEIVGSLSLLHGLRAVALRLLSPISAERRREACVTQSVVEESVEPGIAIDFREVTVAAGGRTLLDRITATIPAGSHVAIVGASGAGKSSLLGLLLGWLTPSRGSIAVDGAALDASRLQQLHAELAWIDPAIAVWDRSLVANLTFGSAAEPLASLPHAIDLADLVELIDQLPEGLRTELGESGARLSGGQGQRVRLGRALLRPTARLVLLDEAFRGLARDQRRALIDRVRRHWASATLLFVSHDVSDTSHFDRVLVLEGGRLVEDDAPQALLTRSGSVYRRLVEADRELRPHTWWAPGWRREQLQGGRLVPVARPV